MCRKSFFFEVKNHKFVTKTTIFQNKQGFSRYGFYYMDLPKIVKGNSL